MTASIRKTATTAVNKFGDIIRVGDLLWIRQFSNNRISVVIVLGIPNHTSIERKNISPQLDFITFSSVWNFRKFPENHFLTTIPEEWLTELIGNKAFYNFDDLETLNPITF